MTFEEVLQARKSVRSYIDKAVEEEKLHAILDAANLAPSRKNSQTARCYVATGETLRRVREALPAFNQRNTEHAPVLIISTFVAGIAGYDIKTGEPSNEFGNGWGAYDCGLHDMVLLLKASWVFPRLSWASAMPASSARSCRSRKKSRSSASSPWAMPRQTPFVPRASRRRSASDTLVDPYHVTHKKRRPFGRRVS